MSDDFGFDPAELFRRSRERRPSRVLRTGPRFPRWQRIVGVAVAIVIEHNLDVVKTADHIIDLGPDGGDRGGEVVATGTPEQVAVAAQSATGEYLRRMLGVREARSTSAARPARRTTRQRPAAAAV